MKLTKTLLFSVITVISIAGVQAQDLHNTLFYMNPLHINPAFAGAYEGSYRIGGIYRDQARTVVTHAYATPSLFVDAPVVMLGKRHWVGVGMLMFRDVAGDGKLRTSAGQLTGSLHLALDKKSKNLLTLGVQWGRVQREIRDRFAFEPGDLLADRQSGSASPVTQDPILNKSGGGGGGGGNRPDIPQKSFSDVNAGLLFTSRISKTASYNLGFSLRHITQPRADYNFGSSNVKLPIRLNLHGQLSTAFNEKWSVAPEFYFSTIGPASQFQLHGWTGYMLRPEKNLKLNLGLGYRFGDSGQLLLGMDYGDVKAAIAYDITLSELAKVNSAQGGIELAVYYIGKIYKKPNVKPVILCPHL